MSVNAPKSPRRHPTRFEKWLVKALCVVGYVAIGAAIVLMLEFILINCVWLIWYDPWVGIPTVVFWACWVLLISGALFGKPLVEWFRWVATTPVEKPPVEEEL